MDSFYYLEKALLSLSPSEHRKFNTFLNMSFFRRKSSSKSIVCMLYKNIKQIFLSPASVNNTRIINWDLEIYRIYPAKRKPTRKTISELKSELFYYLLDFLAVIRLKNNPAEHRQLIMNELQSRRLNDIFDHYCKTHHINENNSDNKEIYANYYNKLIDKMNEYKEKLGIATGEADFIIEESLRMEMMLFKNAETKDKEMSVF